MIICSLAFIFVGLFTEMEASGLKKISTTVGSEVLNAGVGLKEEVVATKCAKRASKRSREEMTYSKTFFTPNIPISINVRRAEKLSLEIPKNMKGVPLSEDPDFPLFARYNRNPEFLPKLYSALNHFTGPSDKDFDPFKGSFSFRFMLDVEKKKHQSQYLFWMMQYRSFMRVKLYQIVSSSDPRSEEVLTKATESLFSEDDIIAFSFAFVEDLISRLENEKVTPEPFVLSSHSDCLIYGYLDSKYFSKEFKDYDVYEAELAELESKLKGSDIPKVATEAPKESK